MALCFYGPMALRSCRSLRVPKVLFWAVTLLAALVATKIVVTVLEPRLAFFPFSGEDATPAELGLPYRAISLRTADGETLRAWFLPHDRPRAAIVYWHGNGGNLSLWRDIVAGVHRQGFSILAFDYRGYGLSTGSPSEDGLYKDTDAVVRHFETALHQPAAKVIYWGRSLGATFAAYAATISKPDALILESAFPDKVSVIRYDPVMRLLNLFASYTLPTAEFLERADCPVLFVHGDADRVIPFRLGRELYNGMRGDKQFVTIRGADHNDFFAPDRQDYWGPIVGFVEGVTPRSTRR